MELLEVPQEVRLSLPWLAVLLEPPQGAASRPPKHSKDQPSAVLVGEESLASNSPEVVAVQVSSILVSGATHVYVSEVKLQAVT